MPVIRIIRSLALGLHPLWALLSLELIEARTNFRVEEIDIRPRCWNSHALITPLDTSVATRSRRQ